MPWAKQLLPAQLFTVATSFSIKISASQQENGGRSHFSQKPITSLLYCTQYSARLAPKSCTSNLQEEAENPGVFELPGLHVQGSKAFPKGHMELPKLFFLQPALRTSFTQFEH